jgi:hypothetical protein
MSTGVSTWVLLAIALVLANMPFVTRRVFFVKAPPGGDKGFGWRLLEVLVLYLVTGVIARFMESRSGPIYPQNWEFYAITLALFFVLAYPGFVYRYLWKQRPETES